MRAEVVHGFGAQIKGSPYYYCINDPTLIPSNLVPRNVRAVEKLRVTLH